MGLILSFNEVLPWKYLMLTKSDPYRGKNEWITYLTKQGLWSWKIKLFQALSGQT